MGENALPKVAQGWNQPNSQIQAFLQGTVYSRMLDSGILVEMLFNFLFLGGSLFFCTIVLGYKKTCISALVCCPPQKKSEGSEANRRVCISCREVSRHLAVDDYRAIQVSMRR